MLPGSPNNLKRATRDETCKDGDVDIGLVAPPMSSRIADRSMGAGAEGEERFVGLQQEARLRWGFRTTVALYV